MPPPPSSLSVLTRSIIPRPQAHCWLEGIIFPATPPAEVTPPTQEEINNAISQLITLRGLMTAKMFAIRQRVRVRARLGQQQAQEAQQATQASAQGKGRAGMHRQPSLRLTSLRAAAGGSVVRQHSARRLPPLRTSAQFSSQRGLFPTEGQAPSSVPAPLGRALMQKRSSKWLAAALAVTDRDSVGTPTSTDDGGSPRSPRRSPAAGAVLPPLVLDLGRSPIRAAGMRLQTAQPGPEAAAGPEADEPAVHMVPAMEGMLPIPFEP